MRRGCSATPAQRSTTTAGAAASRASAFFHLRDGLIARYEDRCNAVAPLRDMGVPFEVIDRMARKWHSGFLARAGVDRHMKRPA